MFDFLPGADVVPLQQTPLQQVIAQVRFNSQGLLSTHSGASAVHDVLAERYPRLTTEQQMIVTAGPSTGVNTSTALQYRMQDLRGDWAVVFGPEHATIETAAYTGWTELRKRMSEVLGAVAGAATLRVRERVGLRYINHVQPKEDGSFKGRIRPEVLGIVSERGWKPFLAGVVGQLIANDNGVSLSMRYGLAPENIGATAPYLVDIDCSDGEPVSYETEEALIRLDSLNDVAHRSFCWCVELDYRKFLAGDQAPTP